MNDCSKFWFANQMGTFQVLNVFDCWYHWCCQLIGSLPWKIIKSTKECWIKFCILVTSSTKKEYAIKNKYIYLKCGFCKKLPLYECNSDQLPTFFHFVITFGWVQQQSNSKPTQKWWQNEKKWATGQSCICKEVTSYKIHTLETLILGMNLDITRP